MKYVMLKESVNDQDILQQPFLKNHDGMILYHGTDEMDEPIKLNFRFRGKPMNTIKPLHDEINDISEKQFGIPIRNLLFSYPDDKDEVQIFGYPSVIIPIGDNYRIFYNTQIHDMTEDMGVSRYSDIPIKDITEPLMQLDDGTMGEYYKQYVEQLQEHDNLTSDDYIGIIGTFYEMEDDNDDDNEMVHVHLKNFIKKHKHKILDIIMNEVQESIESLARQYVEDLKELGKNESVDGVELMIYAPDGFYIIPENTKLYNMLHKG